MPEYYELEVSLKYLKPRIWRRFLMRRDATTFADLHHAIQDAFGWMDSHLWEFRGFGFRGEPLAGAPTEDQWDDKAPDAHGVELTEYFLVKGDKCIYTYDFGDSWEHEVKLRKLVTIDEDFHRRLLAGRRAGPPEDCGGPPGYQRLVHYVQTGDDAYEQDEDELSAFLDDWHPERFELAEVRELFDR